MQAKHITFWEGGIRSTEMLSRATTENIAATLAKQKPLVFLSHEGGGPHKTTKRYEVSLLHSWLNSKGIQAFLDEHNIRPGDSIADVILDAAEKGPVCES
jgi:hypothetical protein